jgi:ABC-2 type transport system ATP-binding protein
MMVGMTSAGTVPAISLSGLTKRYDDRVVVDALDLELPVGVVAGLVGPNGAGKTTTMAMLLGLVRPTTGTGAVLGCSIDEPSGYLGRVGALIETPAFYPSLTGAENLRVFAVAGGHATDNIADLLDVVGLAERGDDRYSKYSLGMKQRLGIAGALLGDPELLILDEPANGLDPEGVREMRSMIMGLALDGRTVLVSSHDLSELEQMCDWLVLIDDGRSQFQGPTSNLLDDTSAGLVIAPHDPADLSALHDLVVVAGHPVRVDGPRLVVDLTPIRSDAAGASPSDVSDVAARINRLAFEAGVVLATITPQRVSLEDRYLSLVEGARS